MARHIDADNITYTMASVYWGKDEQGRYIYRNTDIVFLSDIEKMPTADVVPKIEYDAVVSAVDNSTKEFLKLHDAYQNAKAEVERLEGELIVERTRRENAVNAYHDTKSEVDRWRRNLEAVLEERAETKSEVAREIFEEIEKLLHSLETPINKYWVLLPNELAELKKKYTKENTENENQN